MRLRRGLAAALFVASLAPLWPCIGRAETPYISVGQARARKTVVAFPAIRSLGDADRLGTTRIVHETIVNDLRFMDLFAFLNPSAYVEDSAKAGLAAGSFQMSDWSSVGADILVKLGAGVTAGNLELETHLYDVHGNREVFARKYTGDAKDAKTAAHHFANDLVEALTGQPGIFLTRIAMSCDQGTRRKEIYIMEFDGTNVRQVTHHRSTTISPAWSPDGTKLAYTTYTKRRDNIKNPDLFELDFTSNTFRLLSNRPGINSGSAYSPDGKAIALTMSFLGNPEIFLFDPIRHTATRLTKSLGFDVDPAWAPDGKRLAFVSTRTGAPMVFSMPIDASQVQRLTFAGQYNATPHWSPDGRKIVFASQIDARFDIFLINSDGTNLERLTKSAGNNEDPFFSPDGNFVAFSSNRAGQANIYVMNTDGTYARRLTYGMGNCVSPKWSNPPPRGRRDLGPATSVIEDPWRYRRKRVPSVPVAVNN